jgi:hypothetical protein
MFAEWIETFVIEPIFESAGIHWLLPYMPLVFAIMLVLPLCAFLIKSCYFESNSEFSSY